MPALLTTAGLLAAGALAFALALSLLLRLVWRRMFYRPWGFVDPATSDVDGIELVDLAEAADKHLYLWHLPPASPAAPVLVFFDGMRGNLGLWNRRWRRIAAAGAGFVAVSYRGYGGSTGRPTEEGLLADCRAGRAFAEARYGRDRVVLHGYSMGCAFAARLASEAPARLILEAATLSIRANAVRFLPFVLGRVMVRDTLSVERWLPRLTAPVLFAYGRRDGIVPMDWTLRMFARVSAPKQIELFDQGNHVNLSTQGLYPRIWAWLAYAPGAAFAEAMYAEERAGPHDVFAAPVPPVMPSPSPAMLTRAAGRPVRRLPPA